MSHFVTPCGKGKYTTIGFEYFFTSCKSASHYVVATQSGGLCPTGSYKISFLAQVQREKHPQSRFFNLTVACPSLVWMVSEAFSLKSFSLQQTLDVCLAIKLTNKNVIIPET